MTRECTRPTESRGLCTTCYLSYGQAVRAGRVTWEELEEAGLSRPKLGAHADAATKARADAIAAIVARRAAGQAQPQGQETPQAQDS